ncbi:MAG: glycoside hydrolase family 95 protein, partial [Prevotellaceae bacterium]|nr:glycoside hydrolase family 95 protein [Prevotellaceae bacterium]
MKRLTGIILLCTMMLSSCRTNEEAGNWKLWYDTPAQKWVEALPLGNGRLGAMVFGNPVMERLQLNEETVWAGQPNNNGNPNALAALPEIRKLLFEGRYHEAQDLATEKVVTKTNHGMSYQPVGDLNLSFAGHEKAENYYRELDISTAIATTRYNIDGVEYVRETFASFPDQVIVVRLTASKKGKISFEAGYSSPQTTETIVQNGDLILKGISGTQEGLEGKVKFVAQTRIVPEKGNLTASTTGVKVSDADAVTVFISMATNFVNYHDLSADADKRASGYMQEVAQKDYSKIKSGHIAYYQQYFNRVKIDLGTTDSIRKPVDARILEFAKANDPHLAALYFQFGRYLLISCSQPGNQPANLQGIWNDMMSPPWDSKYTTNINAEMNYWHSEVTNLPELHQPFINMVKELAVTGAETAKLMYGARGWVLHHNTDIWRTTGPVDQAVSGMWPSGGAWVSEHLWERYLYSGDKKYLAEVYPVMKGAALFFLDYMVEEPEHQWLVVAPSNSPENSFKYSYKGKENWSTNAYGITMDNQLLFELFNNLISASETLNIDQQFADTLRQTLKRLPPMHIGQHSQLQEWLFDWDNPNDKHRHVSHLYGVYPSYQISPTRTPELFDAARTSLNYRGDPATGWSMGWKVCLWARFLDGNRAYKLITEQLKLTHHASTEYNGGGTYANMFDAHPPFQIDGNFGCTAGIAEMFVQSHDGAVHILPALPDIWRSGKISGLRTRGGFLTDIEWENGEIKTLKIKSLLGGNLRIRTSTPLTSQNGNLQ